MERKSDKNYKSENERYFRETSLVEIPTYAGMTKSN